MRPSRAARQRACAQCRCSSRPHRPVSREGTPPGVLVVHDRRREIAADHASSRLLLERSHIPWRVHVCIRHTGELRQPAPDIRALRVKPPGLRYRIEDEEPGLRIAASGGGPLSPATVRGEVVVE